MIIKHILVLKETRKDESRVALTPKVVSSLVSKHYKIRVESRAGVNAGFTDSAYVKAGAEIFTFTSEKFPPNTLILRVKRAHQERERLENNLFQENVFVMGFLSPFEEGEHVDLWQAAGIMAFSLDLFKKLSIEDPKNMQAAMSRVAGRLAFHDARKRYKGQSPVKLTILGAGPAAFSAAFEARKYDVPVQVFGRQEGYRAELESAGIIYYVLPAYDQAKFIRSYLSEEAIVITAARTPGQKAPVLIDEDTLRLLPKGAVVVDLVVSQGGNVLGSKRDQVIIKNGVSIVNNSAYPKAEPREASEAYANCLGNLLVEVLSPRGDLHLDHELLKESWVTRNGERNSSLFEGFKKSDSKLKE